jgi:hypothetical protein
MAEPTQETPAAVVQPKAEEKPGSSRTAELEAEVARLLAAKAELESDVHKYRKRNEEEIKKAKEAGDFAKLLEAERERAAALEARIKSLEPDAAMGQTARERAAQAVSAAKADPAIPGYVKRALESARSPIDAAEILAEYRAEQKPIPPVAPALGAAPANGGAAKGLSDLSPEEILSMPQDKLNELLGSKKNGSVPWWKPF